MYIDQKRQGWETTLQSWHIERGLLISYNPMKNALVAELATVILEHSDSLATTNYCVIPI